MERAQSSHKKIVFSVYLVCVFSVFPPPTICELGVGTLLTDLIGWIFHQSAQVSTITNQVIVSTELDLKGEEI